MAGGRPQAFVKYRLHAALETSTDQDIIATLRLLSRLLVASSTTTPPTSIDETVIKVPEHWCTIGPCHVQIHSSSHLFSLEVCPDCDPSIIAIRLCAIVRRVNRDAWVGATILEIMLVFGDLSYFSNLYSTECHTQGIRH